MTGPACAKCGNDGSAAALYLTVDARYDPAAKGWTLTQRDGEGGQELDCLACDHRSPVDDKDEAMKAKSFFPYQTTVRHHSEGLEFWIGTITDSDGDLHGSEIIWGDGLGDADALHEFTRMMGGLPAGMYPEGCDIIVHGPYLTAMGPAA